MRDVYIHAADHGDIGCREIVSTLRIDAVQFDARWVWCVDDGDGGVSVAMMPMPGSDRHGASIDSDDIDRLQRAWDTWHSLIDDPATAPDAVLHWLAEVTPARAATPVTDEETTT